MAAPIRVLYVGDVVGRGGRAAVRALLPGLRQELQLDAVFMNAENLAHGRGITEATVNEMLAAGVDWGTSGNHIWDNEQGVAYMQRPDAKVLRPANFPTANPGNGWAEVRVGTHTILLINLIGQVFMEQPADNPFHVIHSLLNSRPLDNYSAIVVDLHAEATSEKQALALYVDGRVSAVVGTHTHVPTADLHMLPRGTALVCDLGYVGATHSVLGFEGAGAIDRFIHNTGKALVPVADGVMNFCSVLLEIDPTTKLPISISRVDRQVKV